MWKFQIQMETVSIGAANGALRDFVCIYLYVQFEFSHRQTDRHLVRQKSNLESKVRKPCKAPFEIETI